MASRLALSFGLAALLVGGFAVVGHSADDEKARICEQAAERYRDLAADLPSEEGVTTILMYKYTFCPTDLEVPVGTVLRWINVDKRTSHSVWFKEDGKEESERLFPEEFVEMTMSEPGDYDYVCGPHHEGEDMRAKVTVIP